MIVITGTKRSGTSMWMQVLQAAGIRTVGAAFSKVWEETIKDANRRGFFETRLRRGIYYATNPHPETGVWIPPGKSRHLGVKVFIPGVVRSDVVYLSRVIASVRPFRQYARSLDRLYAMERENHQKRGSGERLSLHMDPALEWWLENFLLVRDISTRRYPIRLVSYESVIENPSEVCQAVFEFLEVGNAEAAARAVHPEDRTQTEPQVAEISHPEEAVFDEYHRRVKEGVPFDESFLAKMNETHLKLLPDIEANLDRLAEERRLNPASGSRLRVQDSLSVDRLDILLHPPRAPGD